MTTILVVALAYIAIVALVLRIFHYMRDDFNETEYQQEDQPSRLTCLADTGS